MKIKDMEYILLEEFQRRNPDLEIKVHSDSLHKTGIGPVSVYYPANPGRVYTLIEEFLVKSINGDAYISTLPLWSGDGTGQEAVLTVTGDGTATFSSYRDEYGQGRFIFPREGDTRTLPREWTVPLQEGQLYWLYTTYSCWVDSLVELYDGRLFLHRIEQGDEVIYPRPSRHWFWTGESDSVDGRSFQLNSEEYSEEQFQELDLEEFLETFIPGVRADVTYLREGGVEFRGFVSARSPEQASMLVMEYLDSFQPVEYIEPAVWEEEEDSFEEVPEYRHWKDDLTWQERVMTSWWEFRGVCRRQWGRLKTAYLDWRYGKPVRLPDHHGRKKYRPGQPDKILHGGLDPWRRR